ncbi:RHS repeat domain-containing protein [Caulobacter endophyticus]|uniref:Teneurin-like YD-shell domain-containing protein n=1 Tax=Caulobacter endophyticus TaxID=2172652 RepID=A0A2T9K2X2_9CAUL|nr:RHS repeat-associated core domain-containing protein [Caulobacter endophyticus]PVM90329.1 hypothetical protein DDF67_10405 [Caulobacter endophyticus]
MRLGLKRLARLSALLCASSCLSGMAYAQTAPIPPENYEVDARGVDVLSGRPFVPGPSISIGDPSAGGLSYRRDLVMAGWRDSFLGSINFTFTGTTYLVSLGSTTKVFTRSGSTFTPAQADGSSLTATGTAPYFTQFVYTSPDGVVARFWLNDLQEITYPNGVKLNYNYAQSEQCDWGGVIGELDEPCPNRSPISRLQSITSNAGYQLHLDYMSEEPLVDPLGWVEVAKVTAFNMTTDYCSPWAASCAFSQNWPSLTYSQTVGQASVTDQASRTFVYGYDTNDGGMLRIRLPGSAADDRTFTYANGKISSVTDATGTWNYAYVDGGSTLTTTVTGPLSHLDTYVSDKTKLRLTSVNDSLNRTRSYEYDSYGRATKLTNPEGDYASLVYDVRGNVLSTTHVAKPGSGLADIVTSATYPVSCASPVTCNQPTSTTDALGKVTDYAYDATHGGLLSVTAPAPTAGAARPEVRYGYAPQYAWYKNASGAIAQAPTPIYKPTSQSTCVTGASCAGTASEIKTTYAYGAAGTANNLLPTTIGSGAGDGTLWASTTLTYNPVGGVLTVDGPLAGSSDTTRYRYDSAWRPIGAVGPDPDGGGALKHRAVRYTYDAAGRRTTVDIGVVNSQSDADWAAMGVFQQDLSKYDAAGRVTHRALRSNATLQRVSQYSYDAVGRMNCSVVRMNPATFGSWPDFAGLPASACTLGAEGADGPDRITYNVYDSADRLTETYAGWATNTPVREARYEYTPNGLLYWVADAKNNLTQLQYDGFDRLYRVYFPKAAVGQMSANGDDLEQYAYDAAGRMTKRRLRDSQEIDYAYDANGNLTSQTRPGGWPGRSYAYDNLGRATSISYPGYTIGLTYDALGRTTAQSAPQGTMSYQYDLAGNRTRVTWPDGFWVGYEYHTTGEMLVAREQGAYTGPGVLATYAYDDLGRRTALWRGNGAATTYGYDAASRLTTMAHDLAGTAQDQTYTYSYNAAGQITARTATNDAYRYIGGASSTKTYASNGLNQYTTVGGVAHSYDANGNLQSDGVTTFGHDPDNQLWATSTGANLSRDPAGRIFRAQGPGGGAATDFLYDGMNLSAEYNGSGGMLRRYIPGPGMDEPLAWYEGAGTANRNWYAADERGSVVAVSNGVGTAVGINTYDEYGVPAAGNLGRYQYTGQTWLPEAGVYNYKARTYSPSLGRFMQTDPIGYGDGINWQAYVGNDPINGIDPLGLAGEKKEKPTEVSDVIVRAIVAAYGFRASFGAGAGTPLSGVTVVAAKKHLLTRLMLDKWPHFYAVFTPICIGSECSAEEVFDCIKKHPAPGATGRPVTNGSITNVNVANIVKGDVMHFAYAPSLSVANVTLSNHTLHSGSVINSVRTVDVFGNKVTGVLTIGTGDGKMTYFNGAGAAPLWGLNSAKIAKCYYDEQISND